MRLGGQDSANVALECLLDDVADLIQTLVDEPPRHALQSVDIVRDPGNCGHGYLEPPHLFGGSGYVPYDILDEQLHQHRLEGKHPKGLADRHDEPPPTHPHLETLPPGGTPTADDHR